MDFINHYFGAGRINFDEDGNITLWEGFDGNQQPTMSVLKQLEAEFRAVKEERTWRNSELRRADIEFNKALDEGGDSAMLVYMDYRKALRDYPASQNFPNGERPSLLET